MRLLNVALLFKTTKNSTTKCDTPGNISLRLVVVMYFDELSISVLLRCPHGAQRHIQIFKRIAQQDEQLPAVLRAPVHDRPSNQHYRPKSAANQARTYPQGGQTQW